MSLNTLALACVAGVLSAGCGGDSPAGPTLVPSVEEVATTRVVGGTVTSAIDGSALGGVTVEIDRHGGAETDPGGRFLLESQGPNGSHRTTLSGPGVVTRQTTVTLRSDALAFTLIPSTFDMASFEGFARGFADGAIIRWAVPPALVVETALVDAPGGQNVATADRIPDAEVERLIARLSETLPLLTASRFSGFASIRRRTTPSGGVAGVYALDAITVVYYTESNGACGQASPVISLSNHQIVSGAVWLRVGCASLASNRTTMVHELGHALGYNHVTGTPSVMRPTGGLDITAFDRAAAAIVSRRPGGNRAPDTDPDTFVIDGPSTLSTRGRVVIVPPIP